MNKEKIRAEIERLLNKEWRLADSTEGKYRCETYRELLEYIDSLPEEPVSEDLEKEINRYIDPLTPADIQENPFTSIEKCAHYFANWQKKQTINKACKWLKEWNAYRVCLEGRKDWFVEQFRRELSNGN